MYDFATGLHPKEPWRYGPHQTSRAVLVLWALVQWADYLRPRSYANIWLLTLGSFFCTRVFSGAQLNIVPTYSSYGSDSRLSSASFSAWSWSICSCDLSVTDRQAISKFWFFVICFPGDCFSNFSKMTVSWIQILPVPSNFQMGFGAAAFLERQSGSKGSKPHPSADSLSQQSFPFNEVRTFQTSGLRHIHRCCKALTSWGCKRSQLPRSSPNIPKTKKWSQQRTSWIQPSWTPTYFASLMPKQSADASPTERPESPDCGWLQQWFPSSDPSTNFIFHLAW